MKKHLLIAITLIMSVVFAACGTADVPPEPDDTPREQMRTSSENFTDLGESETGDYIIDCDGKSAHVEYSSADGVTWLKVNDKIVGQFSAKIDEIRAFGDLLVVITVGTDVRSTCLYAIDVDTAAVDLKLHELDENGMVIDDANGMGIRYKGNKIIFEGTRWTHGPAIVDGPEFMSAEWAKLSDEEVLSAKYEIEYLGNGEFADSKQVEVTETVGSYNSKY